MDRARGEWPAGVKHPQSGLYGLCGPLAYEYLAAMGTAARYARASRWSWPNLCVTPREERRVEEAPATYKPIGPVLDAQE
jgi:hypothetical protein